VGSDLRLYKPLLPFLGDLNSLFKSLLIFTILIVMPLQGFAATPKETVEDGVGKVIATLSDAAFKSKSKDEKVAKLNEVIGPVFDFHELSMRTLGREWKKMNPAQQEEFVKLFKELLQGVYADLLLAYSDQKVLFDKETMLKEGQAEVQSFL
jgi:phospholipid transport system substrate-binding protein